MSAYTEFYAHHRDNKMASPYLSDHLAYVGKKTCEIISETGFKEDAIVGYYAGLLHDIGKINPFYQELFAGKKDDEELLAKLKNQYPQIHAPYSAWIARKMLDLTELSRQQMHDIIILIYKHHGKLVSSLGDFNSEKSDIREQLQKNFDAFALKYKNTLDTNLNWDLPDDFFSEKISFNVKLKECEENFFRIGFLFSALLQADRGSFTRNNYTRFNIDIDTDQLKNNGKLSDLRTDIQKNIFANYDDGRPIQIINAPTGTGKTKAFLDIVAKYGKNYSRVFYFSPLLALSSDIESKITEECKVSPLSNILKYNSVEIERLEKKNEINDRPWNFDYESFNMSFIITTMQRLLITIYSPRNKDKLKLASFRNSLLILDEVQTIPSSVLSNLIYMLELMCKYIGTKVLLISATIPHILNKIPKIDIPEELVKKYNAITVKKISYRKCFDIENISKQKFLLMLNTRKKAVDAWDKLQTDSATYITAGLTKQDRQNEIKKIKSYDRVISTQAIEAGVDISFATIYREMAPLDSIVQVLGRLNRECDESDPLLVIFETDKSHNPYSKIEYEISKKYIQDISDSKSLYHKLDEYYKDIHDNDHQSSKESDNLCANTKNMNFGRVWSMIQKLSDSFYDNVFVPKEDMWDDTRAKLLNGKYDKVSQYSATLPVCYDKMQGYFDEKLLEKNILLPKKDKLSEIYDARVGLDKWLRP